MEELTAKIEAIDKVLVVKEFLELDYQSEQAVLERLQREKEELERSSDRRKTLKKQLDVLKGQMAERADEISMLDKRLGGITETQNINNAAMERLTAILAPHAQVDLTPYADGLRELQEEQTLTLKTVEEIAAGVTRKIQSRINRQTSAIKEASNDMLPRMAYFLRTYPEETNDKKAEEAYAPEFAALRKRLEEEDLPRHQQDFEKFLSVSLIGDVAMFSTKLEEHRKEVECRIEEVNRALETIPFSDSSHVQIVTRKKSPTDETAEFRAELKACLAGGLVPSADDRTRIFNQIRELIAKFEKDEAWTRRVTDARNWLEFGVRELANADGREINYFSASSGRSGGQKTKLAFTILASSITAQYGLVNGENPAATFRFVVIDKAFARTDEANSEQALKLFKSLGLQLLVVSPFDAKSRIMEDYVDSFHLALNPEGNSSQIRIASRVEYDAAYDSHAEPRRHS